MDIVLTTERHEICTIRLQIISVVYHNYEKNFQYLKNITKIKLKWLLPMQRETFSLTACFLGLVFVRH
jgi:hypothetical protein